MPSKKPIASNRPGARPAVQTRTAAASGKRNIPMLKPVRKLKVIRKPATAQAANHCQPPCEVRARFLQMMTAAISTAG